MAHADAEAEPLAGDLMDERRHLRVLERVAGVDVRDARAERDLPRRDRQRAAERQPVTGARAVDAGESFGLDSLRELDRCWPAAGNCDEAHGGFRRHSPSIRLERLLELRERALEILGIIASESS
jgi:hypothetical protein